MTCRWIAVVAARFRNTPLTHPRLFQGAGVSEALAHSPLWMGTAWGRPTEGRRREMAEQAGDGSLSSRANSAIVTWFMLGVRVARVTPESGRGGRDGACPAAAALPLALALLGWAGVSCCPVPETELL